jgi:hypothetical protein
VQWVCCDTCSRWDIFENCKKDLGLEEYDADKVRMMEFVCRMCVSGFRVEKLEAAVKQAQEQVEVVTSKVRDSLVRVAEFEERFK